MIANENQKIRFCRKCRPLLEMMSGQEKIAAILKIKMMHRYGCRSSHVPESHFAESFLLLFDLKPMAKNLSFCFSYDFKRVNRNTAFFIDIPHSILLKKFASEFITFINLSPQRWIGYLESQPLLLPFILYPFRPLQHFPL